MCCICDILYASCVVFVTLYCIICNVLVFIFQAQYTLIMRQGDPRLHSIRVNVTDANGNNIPTSVDWTEDGTNQGIGTFIPTVTGSHMVRKYIIHRHS